MSQLTLPQFALAVEQKELIRSQREVLLAIRHLGGRATLRDVALFLRKEKNCVSGRFTELVRRGCLKKAGKAGRFTLYEVMEWPSEG